MLAGRQVVLCIHKRCNTEAVKQLQAFAARWSWYKASKASHPGLTWNADMLCMSPSLLPPSVVVVAELGGLLRGLRSAAAGRVPADAGLSLLLREGPVADSPNRCSERSCSLLPGTAVSSLASTRRTLSLLPASAPSSMLSAAIASGSAFCQAALWGAAACRKEASAGFDAAAPASRGPMAPKAAGNEWLPARSPSCSGLVVKAGNCSLPAVLLGSTGAWSSRCAGAASSAACTECSGLRFCWGCSSKKSLQSGP